MKEQLTTLADKLERHHYVAEPDLVTTLSLMDRLGRPLLLEGEAGVGKTEVGKILAEVNDCQLIRLQCYDGLDASTAVYEWNYSHQLLSIKLMENDREPIAKKESSIFTEDYLLERPLLKAIRQATSPVLLIDEIDRTDEAFEAFLLELLSDFQISIPELGTIKASSSPRVILTSNGTRELSDALRRRCLYYYMDFPDFEKELRILHARLPGIQNRLAMQIAGFVQKVRKLDLRKQPGVAETLDWASALTGFGVSELCSDEFIIQSSKTCLFKTREDLSQINDNEIVQLIEAVS
ncbi:MAG: MoxR family ATPase [Gammaproteobacteria bacterium]|nr:MoxR family ATPase [Gammaproteobacteria bacterium]